MANIEDTFGDSTVSNHKLVSTFGAMLSNAGLSEEAAARLVGVKRRAILRWISDGGAPKEAIKAVRELVFEQNRVAEEICDSWEQAGKPHKFSYLVSSNDADAISLGWPSRDAQLCAVAIAQFILHGVTISVVARDVEDPSSRGGLALP